MNSVNSLDDDEVLIVLAPAPARRVVTLAMLYTLAGLLIYVVFTQPPTSTLLMVFVLVLAACVLWLAIATMRATRGGIVLTRKELRTDGGRVLCRVEDVKAVDRGAFAFKPSGGFLVRLKGSAARGWAPGLWWRFGRSLGIGGVTSAAPAKAMAELLSELARGGSVDFSLD